MSKKEQEMDLNDFGFDDEVFFNISPTAKPEPIKTEDTDDVETPTDELFKVSKKEKKEIVKEGVKQKEEASEEEEEIKEDAVFFNNEPEIDTDVAKSSGSIFKDLTLDLKDKGVFSEDILKDLGEEDITEEKFFELQEKEIELRVDETFEAFFEEMDEDAKSFLKFKKEGGNTYEFLNHLIQKSSVSTIEDIETESDFVKETFLRNYYKTTEGLDDSEIEDKLEFLKEKGKIDVYATKFFEKEKLNATKREQELLSKQEEIKNQQELKKKEQLKEVVEVLSSNKEIKNFKITSEDKATLANFIYKPTVKTGKNQYISEFQKKLTEAFADKEKLILIAKLLKSDFNTTDLVEKGKKELTKEVKKSLSRLSQGKDLSTSNTGKKSLADYF
jgi:hypothetical protein